MLEPISQPWLHHKQKYCRNICTVRILVIPRSASYPGILGIPTKHGDPIKIPRQCGNACAIGGVLGGAKFKCRAAPSCCQKPLQPPTHDPDPHRISQPPPNSPTTPSLKPSSLQALKPPSPFTLIGKCWGYEVYYHYRRVETVV